MILDIALSTPAPAKTPRPSGMFWKWKKIANCLLGRGFSALASDFIRFFHLFASHLQRRVCSQQLLRFWIFKGSEKVSTFETKGWKRFLQFVLSAQTSELFLSSLAARFGALSLISTSSLARGTTRNLWAPFSHGIPECHQEFISFVARTETSREKKIYAWRSFMLPQLQEIKYIFPFFVVG